MPKIDARFIKKETPIFTTIIDDYESINKHVKFHILAMKKEFPQGVESNVRAWRSHWFTHKITKAFDPLVDIMTSACDYVSEHYYNDKEAKVEPFNFWVMDYLDGDQAVHHNHWPSLYSVVYFVDVEKGCAPLIVEDEVIQPENGMLVVFPGNLDHEVPPTKGRRIGAAGNFHLIPVDIYANPPEPEGAEGNGPKKVYHPSIYTEDKFRSEGFQRKVAAAEKQKPTGFKP